MSIPRPRRRPFYRVLTALAAVLLVPGGVAVGAAYADSTNAPADTRTAVELNGQLQVCGTKLCNENRQPVQLRGMSTHGLQWFRNCVNDSSMNALANDWNANVMRLSMYIQEGGYETDPEGFTQMMHELIEEVSSRGMYVIVDWHMLDPGDPNYNLGAAKTFFAEIAERHADKPNILYEVANEPNGVDWQTIKGYHEEIIPVIREQDPDSVILLGTRAWSSLGVSDGADESEVIDNPVNAENVMYTFHFYAASHGDEYLDTLSRAADQVPMFVSEFGTQEASGDGGNDFAMAQRYIDLMAEKGIGWTNWNYSDDFRSGAVFNEGTCPDGPYAGTGPLKEAGQWIRERVQGSGSNQPPAVGEPQEPTTVSGDWEIPWDIGWLPDGERALVTERETFQVYLAGKDGSRTEVGQVPNSVSTGGEGGLMGVAVPPEWDGATNQDVYFMHTSDDNGDEQNRIVRMAFDGETLSNREVIVDGIDSSLYHNGGRLAFGPDGFLYATTGDAQNGDSAQDQNSLNGKILRVTTDGEPAPGNPLTHPRAASEVYSMGHRNPQGLAWDSEGRLWSSELGDSSEDELNLIEPGDNYGWPTCEGACDEPGMTNPKHTWSTDEASPSGLAIVGDTAFMATLRGQRLWRIELSGTDVGEVTAHFEGGHGRLRAVEKVPGANAIWISTSNSDNNGDGSPDQLLRSEISTEGSIQQAFSHPGVLLDRDQLDAIREHVDAGDQPWQSAYDDMAASDYASLGWEPVPYEIVECGSYSDPNIGCTEEREDAIAAYTHALLWHITQDSAHADKAIEIMNAWSETIQDHTNSNAPLQTGWSGSSWARAAEIIRYTYDGWPDGDVDRFADMLRDVYLPEIIDGAATKNGNWELIMMDAATGISVFTEDRASFDKAVDVWRGRVPANLYVSSDGELPHPPPNSDIDTRDEIIDYWHGQDTFVDGLSQETCRRFGYAGWGIAAASHTAETAYHQGIDLYGEVEDRLTAGMEFHADFDLGADVPDWLCGGAIDNGLGPTFEVGYNHYQNRTGIDLPSSRELLETQTRPAGTDDHFLAWETLTHANNP